MFVLDRLPFSTNSLEPYMSEETLKYHYGKHHKGYVDKLNELLLIHPEKSGLSLQELIFMEKEGSEIYNQAAQIWNHNFFWKCIKPQGSQFDGKISLMIKQQWESLEKFQEEFKQKATENFGSGYTWLILNENYSLDIVNTSNAVNHLKNKSYVLLILDVWEHSYYIDCRNSRSDYINSFWKIVNWEFVNNQLEK